MSQRDEGGNRMRYISWMTLLLSMLLLVSCGSSDSVDDVELANYEVNQTIAETVKNDFIFRLASEKEEYEQGEHVELYGEVIYTGEKEEITIAHSAVAIQFNLHEHIRGFEISSAIPEIGIQTELVANEPYRENYEKQHIFKIEDNPKDYVEFIDDFQERQDFPPGYYVVQGSANFYDGTENHEMKAKIDFKVRTE